MLLRLLLVLLLSALTGCTSGYFHLTNPWSSAGAPAAAKANLTKDNKARFKVLSAVIKEQQKIIDRYNKQDPAKKLPDPLTFVTDVQFAEAKARLAKAQAERDALGS